MFTGWARLVEVSAWPYHSWDLYVIKLHNKYHKHHLRLLLVSPHEETALVRIQEKPKHPPSLFAEFDSILHLQHVLRILLDDLQQPERKWASPILLYAQERHHLLLLDFPDWSFQHTYSHNLFAFHLPQENWWLPQWHQQAWGSADNFSFSKEQHTAASIFGSDERRGQEDSSHDL